MSKWNSRDVWPHTENASSLLCGITLSNGAGREQSFLPTIKGEIDTPQYNCIVSALCLYLGQTRAVCSCSAIHLSTLFLLFVRCQAVISDCLAEEKFLGEKSTRTLDKVPPAGPGCQAGRIPVDSMISHGNESGADVHALNYTTLRPRLPQTRPLPLVYPLSPYLRVKLWSFNRAITPPSSSCLHSTAHTGKLRLFVLFT